MKIAKVIALLGVLAMSGILVYGFTVGNFSGEGTRLLAMPWGIVSLVDLFPFLSTGNHMRAISHWQSFNTEKAEEELGLKTRPFIITITDAMSWFRENGVKV